MSTDPRIGSEIAGYRIESVLGRGGMSVVYIAEHARLQRKAALKLLSPDLAEDARFRDRFIRESQLAAGLDHPNIVPVYEAGEAEGLLFIAMRYVRGTDLKSLLARDGALEPRRAVSIVSQVASALDAAHEEGLVHRDVKPGNILIAASRDSGGGGHVYLSDFGVTKRVSSDSGITATGQFVGTLDYAAPEQIEGRELDGRTDEYSLGCVLFECVTGELPFKRDSEMAVLWAHVYQPPPDLAVMRPDLPEALSEAVAKAIAKAPADRYPTCGEFAEAARKAVGMEHPEPAGSAQDSPGRLAKIHAERQAPPVSLPGPRRRGRLIALVVASALVAGAVTAGVILSGGKRKGSGPSRPSVVTLVPNSAARVAPTGRIVADIRAGDGSAGIATGAGSVWIVSTGTNTVWRIDTRTNRVVAKMPVGFSPVGVTFGVGSVWVTNQRGVTVSRIDPQTNQVVRTIAPSGAGPTDFPTAVAVGEGVPDVWVLASGADSVWKIDPATNQVVDVIPVGPAPTSLAAGEGAVWVADEDKNVVYRIDPRTDKVVKVIPVGSLPIDLAVGSGSVFVVNKADDTMQRIDPVSNTIVAITGLSGDPTAVAIGEGFVWVATGDSVLRVDPGTNVVVGTTKLRPTIAHLAVGEGAVWASLYA